ncbi:MAG TPA: hypothetical protein ENJ90_12070 [Devosia sp.]|nr:hypothetical protein [Devosia sp.]
MKKPVAGLVMLLAATSGANATSSMFCNTESDEAGINLTIGSGGGAVIVGADFYVGDKLWSTSAPYDSHVAIAQGFIEGDRVLLDLSDRNFETIIARLRLFTASQGEEQVSGGTLMVAGEGVFAVSCSGP